MENNIKIITLKDNEETLENNLILNEKEGYIMDKLVINRTLLAIGISFITIIVGFWLAYILYNIVMSS